MKKGLKLFATVLTVLLLSTGCVKYETTMTINDDNSVNYSTIIGYNKEDITKMGGTLDDAYKETTVTEDMKKEYKKAGINIESYEDDTTIGVNLYKNFDSIDDITTQVDTSCELDLYNKKVDNQYCFKKTKGFFFDTYTAKISTKSYYEGLTRGTKTITNVEDFKQEYNITDEEYDATYGDDGTVTFVSKGVPNKVFIYDPNLLENYNNELNDMMDQYSETASLKFILNNYSAVGKNNATKKEKDGKRLIWDFTDTENKVDYIEFEIKRPNWLFIILSGVTAIFILILIIGIIVSSITKKAEEKKERLLKAEADANKPQEAVEQIGNMEENPMVNALLAADGKDVNNLAEKKDRT